MNNSIMQASGLTMSSLEIAAYTGKRHLHVLRDIRRMLAELGEGETKFGSTYLDGQGKAHPAYSLPKRELLILVSGYSVQMRAAIIDRVAELENLIANATGDNGLVTDLAAEVRQVVGGIVKSVVHSQLTDIMPTMVAGYVAEHSLNITDGVTAGEVCDLSRVSAKYPRGIAAKVSAHMVRFCAVRNISVPVTRLGRVRAMVFPTHAAREWLDLEGRSLIKRWVAEKTNQTALRLVGGRAA